MVAYSAPDIYTRIRHGNGHGPLTRNQDFTASQQDLQDEINQKITALNTKMNASWTGDASTQAVSGAMPLADATDQAATSLGTASTVMGDQVSAFTTAYNSVQPMAATPPQNNVVNEFVSALGANTPLDNQISQYNNAANNNVQVYNTYSSASSSNAAAMPTEYGTLPNANPTIAVVGSGSGSGSGSALKGASYGSYAGSGSGSGGGYEGTSGSAYRGSSGVLGTSGGGFAEPGGSGSVGAGSGLGVSGFSGPSGFNEDGTQLAEAGGTDPAALDEVGGSLGEDGLGFGLPGLNSNGQDEENNSNNKYGAGTASPFAMGGGPGMGAGGDLSGMSGSVGASGTQLSPGDAARNAVNNFYSPTADEALSRATMAGEPGMGGPMGGVRGKKGEEDEEYKTAEYLQEADPDSLFGSDQLIVPPVIGE